MFGPFETLGWWRLRMVLGIVCWGVVCWLPWAAPLSAQPPAPAPKAGTAQQAQQPPPPEPESAPRPRTPYEAYERGLYDQALQGFVDQQVERPEDPELLLNVGSVHYKMRDYAAAEEAFVKAATAGNDEVREQALYNLGNTAFRQGQLEEAVQRYQAALEIDPDDEDAKFNLEFVRDEIRRRHEEAQKRQQEQGGQQQPQPQEGQDSSNQGQQDQQQGASGSEQQPDEQQGQQQQEQGEEQAQAGAGADRDGDGLPDQTELGGANPTDPDNPDSDGDGLRDGEEDRNQNGQMDEGETDPNRADTDGDGIPDGEEEGAMGGAQAAASDQLEGMTQEEAERYLQALEEGRPRNARARPGRNVRVDKDW